MLTKNEIQQILNKGKQEVIVADERILEEAKNWDFGRHTKRPERIACIYTWMKEKYSTGDTLDDMVNALGICPERISHGLRLLENHGYMTIARTTKPFIYRIVK